jgi:recombination protein RecA
VAPPFREVEIDLIHGVGFSREADLLDAGLREQLVEKSGSWFSFGGERLGQGRENARSFLCENNEVRERLEAELRARLGLGKTGSDCTAKSAASEASAATAASQARSA